MNWAKGGTKTGRGGSFKASLDYVLHDKDGQTDERVGEIEMLNLAADDPKRAWREMQTTVDAVSAIKARNGIPQTGSKNQRPVYAISLSWHPDDKPDAAHMMATGREVIALLGLKGHQAMIVQHTDRPHPHIHIVVNLVHPETGLTAKLYRDEMKLDRWAHEYEASRQIRSFNRAAKMERRVESRKHDPEILAGFEELKAGLGKKTPRLPEKEQTAKASSVEVPGRLSEGKATQELRRPSVPTGPSPTPDLKAQPTAKREAVAKKHWDARLQRQKEMREGRQRYAAKKAEIREKYRPALQALRPEKTPEKRYEIKSPRSRVPAWMQLAGALLKNAHTLPERLARKAPRPKPEIKEKAQEKFERMRGWKELAEKPIKLAKRLPRSIAVQEIKKAERAELYNAAKAYGAEFQARHADHQRQERAEQKEMRDWAKGQDLARETQDEFTKVAQPPPAVEPSAPDLGSPGYEEALLRLWHESAQRSIADRGQER